MKLRDILRQDGIRAELSAQNKDQVIHELSEIMCESYPEADMAGLEGALTERERLGSTGIGHGVAILHGKIPSLDNIVTGFGRSTKGITFDAQDGEPVHLFFVLIAPKNSASLHLKAMARLSRLLKDAHFRNRLYEAADAKGIYDTIIAEDEKF